MRDFVDTYRNVIIQIATPHSTGTGFFLKSAGLIVTNQHVIDGSRRAIIEGERFAKQLSPVVYADKKFDLAFLEAPKGAAEMPELRLGTGKVLRERDPVTAIGHPFGLKFSVKSGIVSNTREVMNGIPYLHIDAALNPGNSGGPLVNDEGEVVGINTFIIQNGDNTGFSLPVDFLAECLSDYAAQNSPNAARCTACSNVVTEKTVEGDHCSFCGNRIQLPGKAEEYAPTGVSATVERIIERIGHPVELSRCGPNAWEIRQGSAKIMVTYHEKTGLITADALLCQLPKEQIKPLYEFLLRENYTNQTLTFSVQGQDIYLSLLIYDRYLNEETGQNLLKKLFENADHYDNILVEQFGAGWKAT
ncbi:MAG: trypsin-like peptidase domain-containing protein [Saprospiraceae bacterium]